MHALLPSCLGLAALPPPWQALLRHTIPNLLTHLPHPSTLDLHKDMKSEAAAADSSSSSVLLAVNEILSVAACELFAYVPPAPVPSSTFQLLASMR